MTNITAMFRTRYAAAVPLLMLLVVIAAGCSSVSDEEFERRVQEEVGRQLAEREAKVIGITPTPTPTPEDESDANGTPNPVPTPRPITAEERKHINEVLGISTSPPPGPMTCIDEFKLYYTVIDSGDKKYDAQMRFEGHFTIIDLKRLCEKAESNVWPQRVLRISLSYQIEQLRSSISDLRMTVDELCRESTRGYCSW